MSVTVYTGVPAVAVTLVDTAVVVPLNPIIVGFSATPGTIAAGGQSSLNATVANAVSLALDGVTIPGLPQFVAPAATHLYTLTATGVAGTTDALSQLTVTVAPSPLTGVLANLAPNTARNMGTYVNPHPDWAGSKGSHITDDSGCFAWGKYFCLEGGAHGPSQETDIRMFDTEIGTWSSRYQSTLLKDMLKANRDIVKGRWINTNQPCASHSYSTRVMRADRLYALARYCQTDNVPEGVLQTVHGKLCSYDMNDTTGFGWTYSARNAPWLMYCGAALDPVSQKIYIVGMNDNSNPQPARIWQYDPDTDQIAYGPLMGFKSQPVELVYNPDDDKFYLFEKDGVVWRITVDRTDINKCTSVLLTTTGPKPVTARPWGYPSFSFDTVNRRMGGCFINGVHYQFDPVSLVWTATTVQVEAGSSGVPSNDFSCSTFMPSVECYVGVQIAPSPRTWAVRP